MLINFYQYLPAADDSKVVLDSLVVDVSVLLKVGHGNLLAGPSASSLSIGAGRNSLDSRGNSL